MSHLDVKYEQTVRPWYNFADRDRTIIDVVYRLDLAEDLRGLSLDNTLSVPQVRWRLLLVCTRKFHRFV